MTDDDKHPETEAEAEQTETEEAEQTEAEAETDSEATRREWIGRTVIGTGVVAGAAVLAPVVGYLIAPVFQRPTPKWESVGKAADFRVGHTVKVTFENISPVPWSGGVGRAAAWLRRSSQTEFTAFSINCTHLGCPVRWLSGADLFMCPCHGGVYYGDGKVAAGPPPKPLPQYPVRVEGGLVQIRTSPLPITTIM